MEFDIQGLKPRIINNLLMSCVVPRPIAWISTVSFNGIYNLAPFSAFSILSANPALISVTISTPRDREIKDTLVNIESTGDFVINIVTEELADSMLKTSIPFPPEVDEFKEAQLTPGKATSVKSPILKESPVHMECKLIQILRFGISPNTANFVIGEVLHIHVKDELWDGEYVDPFKLHTLARTGGFELYCRTRDIIKLERPKQ